MSLEVQHGIACSWLVACTVSAYNTSVDHECTRSSFPANLTTCIPGPSGPSMQETPLPPSASTLFHDSPSHPDGSIESHPSRELSPCGTDMPAASLSMRSTKPSHPGRRWESASAATSSLSRWWKLARRRGSVALSGSRSPIMLQVHSRKLPW